MRRQRVDVTVRIELVPAGRAFRRLSAIALLVWAVLLLGAGSGCSGNGDQVASRQTSRRPEATAQSPSAGTPSAGQATDPARPSHPAQPAPVSGPDLPQTAAARQETWDVVYMKGVKVGYAHTTIEPVAEHEEQLVRITSRSRTTLQRFGESLTVDMSLVSVERPNGSLVRFRSEQKTGPAEMVTEGRCDGQRLILKTRTPGKELTSTLPWDATAGGFFAVEWSLRKRPMEPGEQRTVRCLVPLLNQIADVRLKAERWEPTTMLAVTQRLLRIESETILGGTTIRQTMWVDQTGDVLKTVMPALGQETYRATRQIALGEPGKYDLGKQSLVHVRRRLERPHQTRRIVYLARLKREKAVDAFARGASQQVEQVDEHTVRITVRAIRPDRPAIVKPPQRPPSPQDLQSNNWIQCDDERIVEIARSVVPAEQDPWKIAVALERHVHEMITEKTFSQMFLTAAEVVQTREGDCTEHAVLLAALCRARKIPARVVVGLVYLPTKEAGAFAYHMWNEVWTGDRWVPIDATLALGGIGAAHLKLAGADLSGTSALSAFLPVMRVIQQLELEILEVDSGTSP